jgi:hypothetical protein
MLLRISALILAATFTAPAVLPAAQVHLGVTIGRHRVYDRDRRDYHVWDSGENRAYRQYLAERHLRYVRYARQQRVQQSAYWHWRHEQLERERR